MAADREEERGPPLLSPLFRLPKEKKGFEAANSMAGYGRKGGKGAVRPAGAVTERMRGKTATPLLLPLPKQKVSQSAAPPKRLL
jgi:hypothetical protein